MSSIPLEDCKYVDPQTLIKEELKELFGLYQHTKKVESVHRFLFNSMPDLTLKEIKQFSIFWAESENTHQPDHKEIKKFIINMRTRADVSEKFEPQEYCKHDECDGSGFFICIKDKHKHLFRCRCNPDLDADLKPEFDVFDKVIGQARK